MPQSAGFALGLAGDAGVAAVEDEPVVGDGDEFAGDVARELFLDTVGGGATRGDEPYTVAHAEHVGVDGKGGLAPHDGLDDVGGLAAYTGQAHELFERVGDLAPEVAHQHAGHAHQVAGFIVGVGHALDVLEDDLGRGQGHGLGGGIVVQEVGGDHVDALVGALGGEDDGHEEAERAVVVELGLGHGHGLLEVGDDFVVEFFLAHGVT